MSSNGNTRGVNGIKRRMRGLGLVFWFALLFIYFFFSPAKGRAEEGRGFPEGLEGES